MNLRSLKMIVIKKADRFYYKVYLDINYTDDELSKLLFDNKLRFVKELSKPICYKRCILAEKR